MDYHKDQIAYARSLPYTRAPLAVQAAHQWLLRYCATHETGGVILGAQTWTHGDWQAATCAQIGLRHVRQVVDAGLATWDQGSLVVHGYDRRGEDLCLRERARFQALRERQRREREARDGVPPTGDTTSRTRAAPRTSPVQPSPVQPSPAQSSPDPSSSPPPDGARDRDDDGDDGDGGVVTLDDLRRRGPGLDVSALRLAIKSGDLLRVLIACGVPVQESHRAEWNQAAHGLGLGTVVVITRWRNTRGDPVRLPSGLRKAREAWNALPTAERDGLAQDLKDLVGVTA